MASSAAPHPTEYVYTKTSADSAHKYLLPAVTGALARRGARRVFELGCGGGYVASRLAALGYDVTAVDPSTSGVRIAREHFTVPRFEVGSSEEDLASRFGAFDCVLSLEVIEHVFLPRRFAACVASLLNPGGVAIVSTPYHSHLKDLARALLNRRDDPLWDYGHIKAFRRADLRALFSEVGMTEVEFHRTGRIRPLAKSAIGVYRKSKGTPTEPARQLGACLYCANSPRPEGGHLDFTVEGEKIRVLLCVPCAERIRREGFSYYPARLALDERLKELS